MRGTTVRYDDMLPGCYDGRARLADMECSWCSGENRLASGLDGPPGNPTPESACDDMHSYCQNDPPRVKPIGSGSLGRDPSIKAL